MVRLREEKTPALKLKEQSCFCASTKGGKGESANGSLQSHLHAMCIGAVQLLVNPDNFTILRYFRGHDSHAAICVCWTVVHDGHGVHGWGLLTIQSIMKCQVVLCVIPISRLSRLWIFFVGSLKVKQSDKRDNNTAQQSLPLILNEESTSLVQGLFNAISSSPPLF